MSSQIQKAEDAHKAYKDLVQIISIGRVAVARLGMRLYELKKDNSFKKAIGDGVNTWEDFLKLPEISLDPREANRSIGVYEEFVLKRGYSTEQLGSVSTKALHYILPAVRSGEIKDGDVDEIMEAGAQLTQNAFRERLYDLKRGPETSASHARTYELLLMRRCHQTGTLQKVPAIKADLLLKALAAAGVDIDSLTRSMPEIT